MTDVTVAHTAQLTPATLTAVRALLYDAFDGDFADEDWDHTLGGLHAYVSDGDAVVAHAAVVQRRLIYQGRALRAGYVEGVAVRADRRGQRLAAAVMAPLEDAIRAAYDLGALGASDMAVPLYTGRGWQLWRGRSHALTPDGIRPTKEDDGGIYVLPVVDLDLTEDLVCDWRDGDVW